MIKLESQRTRKSAADAGSFTGFWPRAVFLVTFCHRLAVSDKLRSLGGADIFGSEQLDAEWMILLNETWTSAQLRVCSRGKLSQALKTS